MPRELPILRIFKASMIVTSIERLYICYNSGGGSRQDLSPYLSGSLSHRFQSADYLRLTDQI
jgi:hypothetical protein